MQRAVLRRVVIVGALVGLTLALAGRNADAHALLEKTVPADGSTVTTSPTEVVLTFTEPVELAFGAIRVHDRHLDRVDTGDAHHVGGAESVAVGLEPDLPRGTYTVTWRVISADGHPIHEAFLFHVGAAGDDLPDATDRVNASGGGIEGRLAGLARFTTFLSLLVLIGAIGFVVAAQPTRYLTVPDPDGFGRRWRRLVVASLIGLLLGTAAAYALHGSIAGGLTIREAVGVEALTEVATTRFGRVALARLGLTAVLGLALWSRRRRLPGGAGRVETWLALAVVVALAATPGLSGHAGTTSPVALNLTASVIHVGAAGMWLGGLVVMVAAVLPQARREPAAAGRVVARFSDIALVAVAAVVTTGFVRSWFEVRTLDALDETYGKVLLAKAVAFLPILAAGFVNNRYLKPRLTTGAPATREWSVLRVTITAEVALAAVVIALTAVLVNLAPARVSAAAGDIRSEPITADSHLGPYHVEVVVEPGGVGSNDIHLTVSNSIGAPAPVESVTVLFRMPDQDIGPLVAEAERLAPGRFTVRGHQLSVEGLWTLEVVARTGRFDEERAEVSIFVN